MVIASFFVVQVIAAFATNSLALLSDAGHMLTDVLGIGMALAAITLATRFEQRQATITSKHTFGLYRLGWTWIDSVAGILIGLWILPRTWRLGRRAVRILLQAAPERIDLDRLAAELGSIDGVVGVHDLHVWTLTSEMDAASAHLVTSPTADSHAVLDSARQCLAERHGIAHGTFQAEPDDHEGCDRVAW